MDGQYSYMQLKFISAQPAIDYYAWQAEVYITQFLRLGYNPDDIYVIAGYEDHPDMSWHKLMRKFPKVNIHIYRDTTGPIDYQPSVQAHLLEKHWAKHPESQNYAWFFHDADFLFTKYFDFAPYLKDNKWYFSDTISYIGADYIKSKGDVVLDIMCQTVNIDRSTVEANQENSGGAQKLIKNVTKEYWAEVYKSSIDLYDVLRKVAHIKKEGDDYGIQIWTASMWAELWTAWKMGYVVEVPKEFDFCWATCHVSKWDELSFFHNAGVPNASSGMFFKADYIDKFPYGTNLDIDDSRCSYKYYEIIKSIDSYII